jgi:PIN domain nuclease of toxin-antitoxin system
VESTEVILLDTHALLWLADARLGRRSQSMADRALVEDQLAVSAITFWEISILIARGRLRAVESAAALRKQVLDDGAIEVPLTGEIAIRAVDLGNLPSDPADRFIIATAIVHNAVLMTADEQLLKWRHTLKRQDARR